MVFLFNAGDQINTLLVTALCNMQKWIRLERDEILNLILRYIFQGLILATDNIKSCRNMKNTY